MNLEKYLSLVRWSETLLSEAFLLVADRHGKNPELLHGAMLLASWSSRHAEALDAIAPSLRGKPPAEPDRVRSALFHDPRVGGLGLVRDLHDLAVLAHYVHAGWTIVLQAARALKDTRLIALAETSDAETTRQIAWIRTHIKVAAPQSLTVPAEPVAQGKATIPLRLGPVSLPDMIWGPAAAGLIMLTVGLLGLLMGQPWLVPSLGPSAYLVAADAAHPSARAYNVIVGHVVGLLAGITGVAAFSAWSAPVVLAHGELSSARVLAAALALTMTVLVCLLLRASHPPAGATALLVALGSISTSGQFTSLAIGAMLLAVTGAVLRRLRMGSGRRRDMEREAARRIGPVSAPAPRLSHPG